MNQPLAVLIVEDVPDDAKLIVRELSRGGFDVTHRRVATAAEMQEALRERRWDVILCDYALPQFSGSAALPMARELGGDAPFIFVSGTIGEDIAVEAMKSGAHDYVMKGNLTRLAPAIRRELREAQTRREALLSDKAMRESEQKYRHLFEAMSDAAFLIDIETGRIIDTNAQAGTLLGRTRGEIVGMPREELHPSESNAGILACYSRGAQPVTCDSQVRRRDGRTVPVQVSASEIKLYGRSFVFALMRDITERKRAENELRTSREQLRALAARLQVVREEERTRVAREIHDELGQMLTALKMDLRWIEHDLDEMADPRLNPILDKAVSATELADALTKNVQRIAAELRPSILDRLGLVMALTFEANQFQQRTGIACRLDTPEQEPQLPVDVVTAIFRIFQEALTNVARHSKATEVAARLELSESACALEVRDNGRGISADALLNPKSLGLFGMKERARQFGGDVTFKPVASGGTAVVLDIPLAAIQKEGA